MGMLSLIAVPRDLDATNWDQVERDLGAGLTRGGAWRVGTWHSAHTDLVVVSPDTDPVWARDSRTPARDLIDRDDHTIVSPWTKEQRSHLGRLVNSGAIRLDEPLPPEYRALAGLPPLTWPDEQPGDRWLLVIYHDELFDLAGNARAATRAPSSSQSRGVAVVGLLRAATTAAVIVDGNTAVAASAANAFRDGWRDEVLTTLP